MGKSVLIVDDSPIIHKLLRRTLEKIGLTVIGDAKNGKEGVSMYDTLSPDLVFMDVTMPVMDGLQAAKTITDSHKDAKIIMLTAMGDDDIMAEAKEAGVSGFLKKPFDDESINDIICDVLS